MRRATGRVAGALAGVLDDLAELVWPTRCVVCDMPGELLCDQCRDALAWIEQRYACPSCGTPHGWLTCTSCGADEMRASRFGEQERRAALWECRAAVCALEFKGAGALLSVNLKDAHELRLASVIAAVMATALDEASAWPAADGAPRFDRAALDAVCFVPTTPRAYARRGYDHMELVAYALSSQLGLPVADVLTRESKRDQRGLGREERKDNLAGSIEVVDDVAGARLLLIDDVITTGATIREACRMLLAHGCEPPTVCGLARVW